MTEEGGEGKRVCVREHEDGRTLELRLAPGFDRDDLAAIRALPSRRWDSGRRAWLVPASPEVLSRLQLAFGPEAVRVESPGPSDRRAERHKTPRAEPRLPTRSKEGTERGSANARLLDRFRSALTIRRYSPLTRRVYAAHVRRFLLWCDARTMDPLADLQGAAEEYVAWLVGERSVSRSYHSQVVSALRFLSGTVLERPAVALSIPRPRTETRRPTVLSPREVSRMLAKARNPKHRALLMLLYSAGLRAGELVRLRPEDLDSERGLLRVRQGKGAKDRNTLLARKAVEAVERYAEAYSTGPWLFPAPDPGRHLSTRSVQRVVKRAAKAAGIEKNVTTHTLRHSFATHLLEGGTNLRVIQELLGHRSARTTQIYTHVARSAIESVRSPLDNLDAGRGTEEG